MEARKEDLAERFSKDAPEGENKGRARAPALRNGAELRRRHAARVTAGPSPHPQKTRLGSG